MVHVLGRRDCPLLLLQLCTRTGHTDLLKPTQTIVGFRQKFEVPIDTTFIIQIVLLMAFTLKHLTVYNWMGRLSLDKGINGQYDSSITLQLVSREDCQPGYRHAGEETVGGTGIERGTGREGGRG